MGYVSMFKAVSKMMQLQQHSGQGKMQVYVAVNGQTTGPFTKTELIQLVKSGTLTAESWVWETGMPNWVAASSLPHVNKLLVLHAPKKKTVSGDRLAVSGEPKKEPKSEPKAEHPLRQDLISAMIQMGFKGPDMTKSIDSLLAEQPDIQISEAIKLLLKKG